MKLDSMYLYGTRDVPEVPKDIVVARIALLHKNLNIVMGKCYLERDDIKKENILKAIKFWENLK